MRRVCYHDEEPIILPPTTMLGALCHYVTHADLKDFQPMKANFGILPALEFTPRSANVIAAKLMQIVRWQTYHSR